MPIFGDQTGGADSFPVSGDRSLFGLFTLSETADVTQINVMFDAATTAGDSHKALIYSSAGVLMVVSAAVAVPAGASDTAFTSFTLNTQLPPGNYYVGSVGNGFSAKWRGDSGSGHRCEGTTYNTPNSTMPTRNAAGTVPNAYVTYNVGGASGGARLAQIFLQPSPAARLAALLKH